MKYNLKLKLKDYIYFYQTVCECNQFFVLCKFKCLMKKGSLLIFNIFTKDKLRICLTRFCSDFFPLEALAMMVGEFFFLQHHSYHEISKQFFFIIIITNTHAHTRAHTQTDTYIHTSLKWQLLSTRQPFYHFCFCFFV